MKIMINEIVTAFSEIKSLTSWNRIVLKGLSIRYPISSIDLAIASSMLTKATDNPLNIKGNFIKAVKIIFPISIVLTKKLKISAQL